MNARIKRSDRGLTLLRALMLGGAIVLILVLGYRQFDRMIRDRVSVWVSVGPMTSGQVVDAPSLELVRVDAPRPAVPPAPRPGTTAHAPAPNGRPSGKRPRPRRA